MQKQGGKYLGEMYAEIREESPPGPIQVELHDLFEDDHTCLRYYYS